MTETFDFATPIDRHGTWCTQWDYVQDRFGVKDLTPFTISDMDFACPPCVLEALHERIKHGVFGYSRWEHNDFLGAVEHWFQQQFSTPISGKQMVYGASVIYIVSKLLHLWSDKGDNVVIHTPAYDGFYKVLNGNERNVLPCPLSKKENNWFCDMNALESLLQHPKTKILLLCSPHNPTGKAWSRDELQQMALLCKKHRVKVISDEIHMDMNWNLPHIPWCSIENEDNPWALISSASKTFNLPALTGAYALISDSKSREAYLHYFKERDGLSASVMTVVAYITAYRQGRPWLDALKTYVRANLNHVAKTLNGAFPEINWVLPQATYLAWIDLELLNISPNKLQQTLVHEEKVAIMSGSTYGVDSQHYLRLNVACAREKLDIGLQGLLNAINKNL